MNKKKCPKCGEENPAEAVMCWACYTPLSGAAPAAATPAGAATAAASDAGEKKKIPPWQMAVVGVAVLGGLYVGVRAVMPSSASQEDDDIIAVTGDDPRPYNPSTSIPTAPAPTQSNPVVVSPTTGNATVAVAKSPFKIVVPPNPRFSVGTMAIIPTEPGTSGPRGAALAAYTRRLYRARLKSWNTLYIYVFADEYTAQSFADYQKRRKGAPLDDDDYSYLSTLWGSCLTRYEYWPAKHVERVLYPSKNPSGWWYARS